MHNNKTNNYDNKDSSSVINRMFSTAMGVFILTCLISVIGPTIDGIIVGSYYSVDEVAAISLTSYLLVGFRTLAASIVATGSTLIVSRLIGSGNKKAANRTFSLSIVLAMGASCFIALVSILFADKIAIFLGARGTLSHLMKPTADYLIGYCLGLPFYTATVILMPYLKMDGDYRLVTISSIFMTVLDILADLYVVKCTSGGLFLIGLATTAGHIGASIIIISHFFLRKTIFHFSLKNIRWAESGQIFRSGIASGVIKLSSTVCGLLINNILAVYAAGEVIAAFGVGNQVLKFCFSFWLGAASTLMSFTSMFVGEEDAGALGYVQKIAVRKSLLVTSAAAALIFLFSGQIALLFIRNADPSVIDMAAESIRFFALSMPLNVVIYCFQFYLMGVGRHIFANLYSFLLELAVPAAVTILLFHLIGYRGVWIAKPVAGIICVLIAFVYIRLQPGSSMKEKMLMLPEGFGFESGEELCFRADSMEDVNGISRVAVAFALENGADAAQAQNYSLAVEELAGNIVQHGFTDGKAHTIDIRMLVKGQELILRLRDDCRRFDPMERYRTETQFDDNPKKDTGIRLMAGVAKSIKYTGLYGMNNLIIRV